VTAKVITVVYTDLAKMAENATWSKSNNFVFICKFYNTETGLYGSLKI